MKGKEMAWLVCFIPCLLPDVSFYLFLSVSPFITPFGHLGDFLPLLWHSFHWRDKDGQRDWSTGQVLRQVFCLHSQTIEDHRCIPSVHSVDGRHSVCLLSSRGNLPFQFIPGRIHLLCLLFCPGSLSEGSSQPWEQNGFRIKHLSRKSFCRLHLRSHCPSFGSH